MLSGNGYLATDFISALTVSVLMIMPQIILLMPLYVAWWAVISWRKNREDGTLRMILARPIRGAAAG